MDSNCTGASWINENKLMVYNSSPESEIDFRVESWEANLDSLINKYIVFEGHSVFSEIQFSNGNDVQSHSHAYRSLLRAAIQELGPENEDDKKLVALYELVWSFCEVLFIEHLPGGCVLPYLMELMQWHFPQPVETLNDVLTFEEPMEHPKFWDCVISLLFQGQISEAVALLKITPDGSELTSFLEKMPLLNNFSGHSLSEFKISWSMWQENCKQNLESTNFVIDQSVDILEILCGNLDVFIKYKDLAQTWYHLMTSYLLYTMPTVTVVTLHHQAKDMMGIYKDYLSPLDEILFSAMEFDAHSVLTQCITQFKNNWWLSAHLADILYHAKQLDDTELQYGCSLREYTLLHYASELIFHEDFWSIGMDYFMECKKLGKSYLEIAIPRIPLENQNKALRVWSACEKHGLIPIGSNVCRVMSSVANQNDRLGLALIWSLQAKDLVSVTKISETILDNYIETGGFSNLDFLDQLGNNKLLSNRLMFLGKYREFHNMIKTQQQKKAADLLVSLVESNLGPPRFQITLLLDSLPLINDADENSDAHGVVMDSRQSHVLLKALEDMQIKKLLKESDMQKVETIRLALVTNLASSFLNEPW